MKYQPNAIFIGLPHSGSTFLRSYFTFHNEVSWERNADHFMRAGFDAQTYQALDAPTRGRVFIDMYELLAINFIVPNEIEKFEQNRFALDFDMSRQQLAPPEMIPSRIKATVPEAKIIIVIRNQVNWLRSHYMYHIQNMPPRHRKFSDYLNCLDGKRVVRAGNYHSTIAAYHEIFGKESVHILLLEQIAQDQALTLKALCAFLNIKYVDFPEGEERKHSGKSLLAGHFIRILSKLGISLRSMQKFSRIYRPVIDLASKMSLPDVLSRNEISLLRSFYSSSNVETANLINTNLAKFGYPV